MPDPTTATLTTSWLDIMPAIPLARSVPAVHTVNRRRGVVCMTIGKTIRRGGAGVEMAWDDGEHLTTTDHLVDVVDVRPDLDDPQGFAYALRAYIGMALPPDSGATMEHDRLAAMVNRSVWDNHVNDADRLDLAAALAEVSR